MINLKKVTKISQIAQNPRALTIELKLCNDDDDDDDDDEGRETCVRDHERGKRGGAAAKSWAKNDIPLLSQRMIATVIAHSSAASNLNHPFGSARERARERTKAT